MADNRITKERVATHWHYGWWKYAIWAALTVFGVSMLFTVTAYHPPEEHVIEAYLCNGFADATKFQEDFWPSLLAACPEQEEMLALNINLSEEDYYANMQISAYMAAHQGDVCLLPLEKAQQYAMDGADGIYLDLQPYVDSGALDVDGLDLSRGMLAREDGSVSLYGIPTDTLYGLLDYNCTPVGGLICVMNFSGNDDTAVELVNQMIARLSTDKPEGYDDWLRKQ